MGDSFGNQHLIKRTEKFFRERIISVLRSRKWTIDSFPVRVVVTGIEHSGTTMLALLLKQHPRLNSGFECGFLLADNPQSFKRVQPWYDWMHESFAEHQWMLNAEDMESICASTTWEEAYRKLLQYSPVFGGGHGQQILDKTPRYLSCLDAVLDKLPDCVPCLVIEKDVENLWRSHKKRNSGLEDFCRNFRMYNTALRKALAQHGDRIHRIQYELLCNELYDQLPRIFTIIQLPFQKEYASKNADNLQQYYNKNIIFAEPLPEEEILQLNSLRREFSDLFSSVV